MVDKNKFYDTIDNKILNAKIFSVLDNESPIWRNYYNPEIRIEAGQANFITTLWNDPIKWTDTMDYKDFTKGEMLSHPLTLKEFGNYGDKFSEDLGKLAFERPTELNALLGVKMSNIINRIKYDFVKQWKEDMGEDGNYNDVADNKGAILKNPKAFYMPGKDAVSGANNAELVWNSIDTQAYKLLDYSDKFNKAKKLICSYGMKDLVLVLRPRIHSMLITQIYSPSANIGYVLFESKFGSVIITELNGNDEIYLHDKNAYQMAVAIDHPANGIYIDTHRYAMGLQNYLFKWFFVFMGMIPFVNAVKWKSTT